MNKRIKKKKWKQAKKRAEKRLFELAETLTDSKEDRLKLEKALFFFNLKYGKPFKFEMTKEKTPLVPEFVLKKICLAVKEANEKQSGV